ncbi:MAG TPA: hypothetical protein VMN36_00260 [Verrucomicrobiales bacterium]|nr:hypothetical protein [Verrucomicrobiales bacterium]
MSFDVERLYELLPAVYRVRDAKLGAPLRDLLSLIAEQVAVLEDDLAQLHDDHFIETCAEWVVPYIGDLVGARGIFTFPDASFSQRAQVANTLAYRRRKGTATVLEQLARDVTGWNVSVVEYFQRLATTQFLNHIRPHNLSFTGLRDWETLEYATSPFDRTARTADVRHIDSRRGKHNIPHIGIHLWRLEAFPVENAAAFRVDARRYRFDPLGRDLSLFNRPETESEITHLAEPINVPAPLSRRVLHENLDRYHGEGKSLLVDVDFVPPPSPPLTEEVCVCDLSDVVDAGGNVVAWAHMADDKIAIDPVLGRIALPQDAASVRVSYQYGFAARMGGGQYGRASSFASGLTPVRSVPGEFPTIQAALDALEGTGGVVEIEDNGAYFESLSVNLAPRAKLELRAADERRPVVFLDGDFTLAGGADSEMTVNGLVFAGGNLRATASGALRTLTVRHCTLSPAATPHPEASSPPAPPLEPMQLIVETPNLTLIVDHSITGVLRVTEGAQARIVDSITDAGAPEATAYSGLGEAEFGGPLEVRAATMIGQVRTAAMRMASNTIFYAKSAASEVPVEAQRLQEGCVRFSYVPVRALVPRKHRCQPAISADACRVKPVFTSLRFGDPAYAQLSDLTPVEIREGADDEAEMGTFHDLYQPQREANLRTRLDEYLRFGLEAGILHAT